VHDLASYNFQQMYRAYTRQQHLLNVVSRILCPCPARCMQCRLQDHAGKSRFMRGLVCGSWAEAERKPQYSVGHGWQSVSLKTVWVSIQCGSWAEAEREPQYSARKIAPSVKCLCTRTCLLARAAATPTLFTPLTEPRGGPAAPPAA